MTQPSNRIGDGGIAVTIALALLVASAAAGAGVVAADSTLAVRTGPADATGEHTATVGANVTSLGSTGTVTVWVEYRPAGAINWEESANRTVNATGLQTFDLTGLTRATTYEYRAVAVDGNASDVGDVRNVTTLAEAPTVTIEPALDVTESSATLNATLHDLGGSAGVNVTFEYRALGASTWLETATQRLTAPAPVTQAVDGLAANTTYEYRAVAVDDAGDGNVSGTATLTTDAAFAAATRPATAVDETVATLNGEIEDFGGADGASVHFEIRPAGDDATSTVNATLASDGTFSGTAACLQPGTTYEFFAVGEATDGDTDTGAVLNFTTRSAENPPSVDDVTAVEDSPPNPHAELFVDWAVSDADGDLSTVTVEITDSVGRTVYSARTAVGGSTATGSEHAEFKHGAGETYTVTVTVADAAGNADSTQVTVAA